MFEYIFPALFFAAFAYLIVTRIRDYYKNKQSTDTILSAFTSTISKLEALAVRKLEAVEAHIAAILHLQSAKDAAAAEAEKAKAAAEKIKALVS